MCTSDEVVYNVSSTMVHLVTYVVEKIVQSVLISMVLCVLYTLI